MPAREPLDARAVSFAINSTSTSAVEGGSRDRPQRKVASGTKLMQRVFAVPGPSGFRLFWPRSQSLLPGLTRQSISYAKQFLRPARQARGRRVRLELSPRLALAVKDIETRGDHDGGAGERPAGGQVTEHQVAQHDHQYDLGIDEGRQHRGRRQPVGGGHAYIVGTRS